MSLRRPAPACEATGPVWGKTGDRERARVRDRDSERASQRQSEMHMHTESNKTRPGANTKTYAHVATLTKGLYAGKHASVVAGVALHHRVQGQHIFGTAALCCSAFVERGLPGVSGVVGKELPEPVRLK